MVVIKNQDVTVKEDGDASKLRLTDSTLVLTDGELTISDVKAADVCVKGNGCNANDFIKAGMDAGLVVKRVGSKVAYDMVSSFVSSECNSIYMYAC